MQRLRSTFVVLILICPRLSSAAEDNDQLYLSQVRPLLQARCFSCHGALRQEAGLRLDTGRLIREGSDGGPIIDLLAPEQSVLLDRVTTDDAELRMPPEGKSLTAAEILAIRQWILDGAESPADEIPEPEAAAHWAFQRPVRPIVPSVADSNWPRNAVDHFLQQRREQHGLNAATDSQPAHLLRRVTIDLTGLPPTPAQTNAFIADPSPDHYARIVDELLASPQYGERWARHWMDVWRYSDWYGRRDQNDVRNSAPQIWRWRDWIIDSLNGDQSYAQMIQEMLAADEVTATDDSTWPATGFLIRSYYSLNPNEWMRHNVEYTGKALLGLTFNCAHCHDHKYDPISHDDYFRMRAFFEPLGIRQDRVVGQAEPPLFAPYVYSGSRPVVRTGMVRVYDAQPEAETWFYTGGDERNTLKERGSVAPGVPAFLDVPSPVISPVRLPMSGWYPGSRPNLQQRLLAEQATVVEQARRQHAAALAERPDTRPQLAELQNAGRALDAAMQQAIVAGEQPVLTGKQSLVMDASSGRRVLQRELSELTTLTSATEIRFQLRILQDAHFNFQLARDASESLTALYFAFHNGEIRAYKPGGFTEFTVARYSVPEVAHHFDVSLKFQPESDSVLLSVQLATAGQTSEILPATPIALNGWNPVVHQQQPLTLDCQSGTRVLLDQLELRAGPTIWLCDFEAPEYATDEEVAGVGGWAVHPLSTGAATSQVSTLGACKSAQPQHARLLAAQAALFAVTQPLQHAEQRLQAANDRLTMLRAVTTADNAIRDGRSADEITRLSQMAGQAQRVADQSDALWRIADATFQRAAARGRPESDPDRPALLKQLEVRLTQARTDLQELPREPTADAEDAVYRRLSPTTGRISTGRRSALAAWITHPHNPLTARVAINHIWMRHFHEPLVTSVYDFGRAGQPPSHPDLLDWLAVELMEHDWSMKHIHQLLVTSHTYQMSSSARGHEPSLAVDPRNRLLWRMNSGRMESEVVRDSLLSIAGLLDPTVGGQVLPNTESMTTFRRSIYYEVFPEGGGSDPLSEVFDAPDPGECFRRTRTVLPQQALALNNGELVHRVSTELQTQLDVTDLDAFVQTVFLRILNRPPTLAERDVSAQFLNQSPKESQRGSFIRAIFNHNDFVTVR